MSRIQTIKQLTLGKAYSDAECLEEAQNCLERRVDFTGLSDEEFSDVCDELRASYRVWVNSHRE